MATNKSSSSKPVSTQASGTKTIKAKDKPPLPGTPRPLPSGEKPPKPAV